MYGVSVAVRCGTSVAMALFAGAGAFAEAGRAVIVTQPLFAGLTSENSFEGAGATGDYTVEDSKAMQKLLEAPSIDRADNEEAVPPALQKDVTSMQTDHMDIMGRVRAPEAKSFAAWDFQRSTVVPEPSTALLMGLGLAAFAAFRGRFGRTSR
ncbi:MAG TPA: PEP-CTERM sorting domain-containing protein [Candidatus Hydrogenedentes bacterium]|nr:PEP-CTERM sorting domain-containing protein [Candidatus Hydrogenedentota bacterium]